MNTTDQIHPFDLNSHERVRHVVELAMTGARDGSREKLGTAFHKSAMMFGEVFEYKFACSIGEFFGLCERLPLGKPLGNHTTPQPYRFSIISITQVGLSAMVLVGEDGCWGSASFVDFFTVTSMDGIWQITNKTFAYTGGVIPPEALHDGFAPIAIR